MRKIFAWAVHLFTASGLIAGFYALLAINQKDWNAAMLFLLIALVIDGIDGTFARMVKVKEVLPQVDGKMIDFVVDFINYAFIPAYFLYVYEAVSTPFLIPMVALILLVSAMYYGKEGMVSEDNYFIGFPVLWNVAAFYLIFIFQMGELANLLIIIALAILHFVPIKCAYPSRGSRFIIPTIIVSMWFAVVLVFSIIKFPDISAIIRIQAMIILLYFIMLCILDTFNISFTSNKT